RLPAPPRGLGQLPRAATVPLRGRGHVQHLRTRADRATVPPRDEGQTPSGVNSYRAGSISCGGTVIPSGVGGGGGSLNPPVNSPTSRTTEMTASRARYSFTKHASRSNHPRRPRKAVIRCET